MPKIIRKNLKENDRLKIVKEKKDIYNKIETEHFKNIPNLKIKETTRQKYKIAKTIKADYSKRAHLINYRLHRKNTRTLVEIKISGNIGKKKIKNIIVDDTMMFNLRKINHRLIRQRIYSKIKPQGFILKYGDKDDNIIDLQNTITGKSVKSWNIKYTINILEKKKIKKSKKAKRK